MTATCFVDTNVLVYANDWQLPHKQALAFDAIAGLLEQERLVLSVQVLNEFAATLLKPRFGYALDEVREALGVYLRSPLIPMDEALTLRALDARERYQISLWDGLIVAAAERGRCAEILTEDLNHGQEYFGVRARNPFLSAVSEL